MSITDKTIPENDTLISIAREHIQHARSRALPRGYTIYTGPVICGRFFLGDSNDGD
jgi:hypothetical protein